MTDPELTGADRLDEDEVGLDPLEGGMDPPERWAEADRHGMTEAEQREGAPLADRLSEEEPEPPAERRDAIDELAEPNQPDDESVAARIRTPHPEQNP